MVKKTLFFLCIFGYVAWVGVADAAPNCLTVTPNSSQADKNYCQRELDKLEEEFKALLKQRDEQAKQTGTIAGDVNYLTREINALKAKIKARTLAITQIKVTINEKTIKIRTLEEKLEQHRNSLAELLRNTNDFDNQTFVHLVLSDEGLSDFYADLESYNSIKLSIEVAVAKIKGIKVETEEERQSLEDKQNAETDARVELENAQKKVAQSEAEKKRLLAISVNKEVEYQKLASEKKARADAIRAALFPLRDSQAIPFGVAFEYAEQAERITGVRAAFVLAILQQESNIGANVGSCVITDLKTGATKGIKSGTVFPNGIHPTRDLPLLQTIVSELGREPLSTRVSCPFVTGYGGAMGPAQFIPSTWMGIRSKISVATGKSMPDPWNPRDAIMASSILLKELGAGVGTFTAERTAALRYYAGGGWNNSSNAFYGNQVMARVGAIQDDIDLLLS